jgi:hypothetical protein
MTSKFFYCAVLTLLILQTFAFDFSAPEFQKIRKERELEVAAYSKPYLENFVFNCSKLPPQNPPPTDARRLRFSDIKVVMALGDSMSAGFALDDKNFADSVWEYRGWVATAGDDKGALTLPNLFKVVGQPVKGGSVGRGLPWSAYPWNARPNNPVVDHLNAARSGARSQHLKLQVEYLARQLKNETGVDPKNDWKILSIVIGANDLCGCRNAGNAPDHFEKNINDTLAEVHKTIPKVFVNIIPIFETGFYDVWNNSRKSTYCTLVFGLFKAMCGCLMGSDEDRDVMSRLSIEYNKRVFKLQREWNARNIPDFYVSVQPFLTKMKFDDLSWTSSFDCFHPAVKANKAITIMNWNSLQLPQERKPTAWVNGMLPHCPTENIFLQ